MQEELKHVVRDAEMQQVSNWSLDQHEHRYESTQILHEATEGLAATKIKPRIPYVTGAILEVFAH